jgi:hypothetical protein
VIPLLIKHFVKVRAVHTIQVGSVVVMALVKQHVIQAVATLAMV